MQGGNRCLVCLGSSKKPGFRGKEVDIEHQFRGRRDHMARSQTKCSRSCPIRNGVPGDSRTELCHRVYLTTGGLLSGTLG